MSGLKIVRSRLEPEGVIIAGGLGTRLRPITLNMPKALALIGGKPIIERLIILLKNAGVTKIWVSVGYLAQLVMDYCGDGSRWDVSIEYLVEDQPMGSGGWLNLFLPANKPIGDFYVLPADVLLDIDLRQMHQAHLDLSPTVTLAVIECPKINNALPVRLDGKLITGFGVKGQYPIGITQYCSTAYFILNSSIFERLPALRLIDLTQDVLENLATLNEIRAFPTGGICVHISTQDDLIAANELWTHHFRGEQSETT